MWLLSYNFTLIRDDEKERRGDGRGERFVEKTGKEGIIESMIMRYQHIPFIPSMPYR